MVRRRRCVGSGRRGGRGRRRRKLRQSYFGHETGYEGVSREEVEEQRGVTAISILIRADLAFRSGQWGQAGRPRGDLSWRKPLLDRVSGLRSERSCQPLSAPFPRMLDRGLIQSCYLSRRQISPHHLPVPFLRPYVLFCRTPMTLTVLCSTTGLPRSLD